MSEKTNISYADHSWSPWLGCEPVSPGCAHCYASAISKRAGRGAYCHGMQRTLTKEWKAPVRWDWNGGGRVLVSMCDPFDPEVDNRWKGIFADLIWDTPNLTWLLLTKRPENINKIVLPLPDNVWLGVSVENQEMADKRIPVLLSIPAKVRFLSIEPMLGPVEGWIGNNGGWLKGQKVDWVIVGGESGFNHRKLEIDWLRSVVDQCAAAGVACYVKQDSARFPGKQGRIPDELWAIKEFPKI